MPHPDLKNGMTPLCAIDWLVKTAKSKSVLVQFTKDEVTISVGGRPSAAPTLLLAVWNFIESEPKT